MRGAATEDIALTAFVLVAMAESHSTCDGAREQSLQLAQSYLESKLDTLTDPYLVALSAYALKRSDSSMSGDAYRVLKEAAKSSASPRTRWWSRENNETPTADDVEMTSYALLASVLHNDLGYAKAIVTWLNLNRGSKAAFKSTQDTVVALHALSAYSSLTEKNRALQLHSTVKRSNDSVEVLEFDLTEENTIVQRQEDIPHGLQYQILTQGVGTGQMTVELKYNVFTNSTLCHFDTNITVQDQHKLRPWDLPNFDVGIDDYICPGSSGSGGIPGPEVVAARGGSHIVSRINTNDRPQISPPYRARSRSRFGGIRASSGRLNSGFYGPAVEERPARVGLGIRREGPRVAAMRSGLSSQNIIRLRVCTRFLASRDTGMSIIEVGLFSGFAPIEQSLERLTKCNSTTYVMNYDVTSRTVVFYLSKIPHENGVCLEFFAKQQHKVGNTQPVAVNVKDYYHPDDKCTTFYHPEGGSELLEYICNRQSGQCMCSEGKCPKCYNVNKNSRNNDNPFYVREEFLPIGMRRTADLIDHVCDYSEVAYKIEVLDVTFSESYYIVETQVLHALKQGYRGDTPVGSLVSFWVRASCMNVCRKPLFEIGKKYLVTGPEGIHTVDENTDTHRITSSITEANYVVEWNELRTGANRKERRHAAKLNRLVRGCDVEYSWTRSRFGRTWG